MAGPPPVRLYNDTDEPIDVLDGTAVPAGASGLLLVGRDVGGVARIFKTEADGSLTIANTGLSNLDVLLSTRASEATLLAVGGVLAASLDTTLSSRASEATLASVLAQLDVALSTRAADRTTAAAPFATRLSDGAAFYKATTPADTQPISAVALPLPTGAATEATLATRATEATLASILAQLDVALSTRAAAATQTDGTQKSIARGGAKGLTAAADVTSTAQSADRQGLDVQVRTSAGVAVDSFGGGTEYTEDVASPADPVAGASVLRRRDTPAAETGADGDWVTHNGTNKGEAYVKHLDPISTKTPLTAAAPTFAIVGAASGSVLAANANRKGLVLTNMSNQRMSFGIGAAAVLDSGITLQPDGVWAMSEYDFTTAEIFAISTAAGKKLAIQEFS